MLSVLLDLPSFTDEGKEKAIFNYEYDYSAIDFYILTIVFLVTLFVLTVFFAFTVKEFYTGSLKSFIRNIAMSLVFSFFLAILLVLLLFSSFLGELTYTRESDGSMRLSIFSEGLPGRIDSQVKVVDKGDCYAELSVIGENERDFYIGVTGNTGSYLDSLKFYLNGREVNELLKSSLVFQSLLVPNSLKVETQRVYSSKMLVTLKPGQNQVIGVKGGEPEKCVFVGDGK